MATNILNLPFRRTHAVSLSTAIKQYISSKYDQHPDMFTKDLKEVEGLRRAAVAISEPHASGISMLQAYAAQLVWMGGKFPIDIGADFTWYPALGYNTQIPMSQNNIRFELANVLFNLAVLYCQLAVASNRNTSDGLKIASNYFCLSAGVISHLKSAVIPEMRSTAPEDMDPMTLECLEQLLLAQAQECFWQKAAKDGLKDAVIAKLAAKVSDLYSQASDLGVQSDTISSEWIHHMTAKHHHFAAAAQYRAACDCLDKRKYGEEVARLRDSLACANEALKESRYINKIVSEDLNGLKNKVQEDLKRAEKDNDMIYLMPVPPKAELKMLDRATMVSAKVPKEVSEPFSTAGDRGPLVTPLFAKLVPYSVHVAASIYADRRDRVIDSIVSELEILTVRVQSLLQSLNLPGSLQALEKPLGLPPALICHAEEIRQQNGLQSLYRSMEDVAKLKTSDRAIYQEGVSWLQSEASEDERARKRFGTDRWKRPASMEIASTLYSQMTEQDNYLNAADASDGSVKDKVSENEFLIRLLSGTDRDLENYVPSTKRVTMIPRVEQEVNKLRGALNDVRRLEGRRKQKVESLKKKAQTDDINPELLREAARLERERPMQKIEAVQFEQFFDKRLERYQIDEMIIKEEQHDQREILSRLAEANTSFTTARRGDSATKDREQALQKLENAYFAYKEIVHNLDVGRKFYNDLATLVGKFRDDCRSFAYQRRSEAAQLEVDITTALPMAKLNLKQTTQTHSEAVQQEKRRWEEQRAGQSGRIPANQELLAAPVPVQPRVLAAVTSPHAAVDVVPVSGMWTPEMGIKFSNVTTPGVGITNGNAGIPQSGSRDGRWDASKGVNFGNRLQNNW